MIPLPTSWPRLFSVFGNGFLFLGGCILVLLSPNDLSVFDDVSGFRAIISAALVLFLCYVFGEFCHAMGTDMPVGDYSRKRAVRLLSISKMDNELASRAYLSATGAAETCSGLSVSLVGLSIGVATTELRQGNPLAALFWLAGAAASFYGLQRFANYQMRFVDELLSENQLPKLNEPQ